MAAAARRAELAHPVELSLSETLGWRRQADQTTLGGERLGRPGHSARLYEEYWLRDAALEPPMREKSRLWRSLSLLAVAVLAIGFIGWRLVLRDTTTPVDVAAAVESFGASGAARPTSTSQGTPETSPTDSADTAPVPGVYVYDTTGSEGVDALAGTRHEYPAVTTITVEPSGCGTIYRWLPLKERRDEWTLCRRDSGLVLVEYSAFHRFFGQDSLLEYTCNEEAVLLAGVSETGATRTATCTTGIEREVLTITEAPGALVEIGGKPVDAVEVEITVALSASDDNVNGNGNTTVWFDMETGLILKWVQSETSTADSPIGAVDYDETFELVLQSLEPIT